MVSEYAGRCLCGAVAYCVDRPPAWIGHCHCASCRRQTGSAVATFVGVAAEAFRVTRGTLATHASSPGVERGFCARCGTPLTYRAKRFPGEVHVHLGTLDEPDRFVPQFHVFEAERIPWLHIDDGLPRYRGTSDEPEDSDPPGGGP